MNEASRLKNLPAYLFARIEKKIEQARDQGIDIINLGIGDPVEPTPDYIIATMAREIYNPANHRYPTTVGLKAYRQAIADWYRNYCQIELDPETEIGSLIGSKEGLAHISFCFVNPGDVNLVPDPAYPVYQIGTVLAGGEAYALPLKKENGFLPDLSAVPSEVARRAKIMFLNYPNNPTGALANRDFFTEVVKFAKTYDLIVCHDAAYLQLVYGNERAPSFLETDGARDVGVEFGSLSKPFNMTGWRIGWVAGNKEVVGSLMKLKSNLDSGVFQAIQYAAIAALSSPYSPQVMTIYRHRRDMVIKALNEMGWTTEPPGGTFYVWAEVPPGFTSESFAEYVLEKAGVVITPGNGYGRYGEGFFRISLTVEDSRLEEALNRLQKAGINYNT